MSGRDYWQATCDECHLTRMQLHALGLRLVENGDGHLCSTCYSWAVKRKAKERGL